MPTKLTGYTLSSLYKTLNCISQIEYTVKTVLRGLLWDKEKVVFKIGNFLKEVQFIRKCL